MNVAAHTKYGLARPSRDAACPDQAALRAGFHRPPCEAILARPVMGARDSVLIEGATRN